MTKDVSLATNAANGTGRTVRDTQIAERLARGDLHREIAGDYGVSRQRVGQLKQEKRELVSQLKEDLRLRALKQAEERWDKTIDGLLTSAEDPQNKNQPQAARAFGELSGMTGKHQNVHFGDNHLDVGSVNVDARSVVIPESEKEIRERMRQLEARLG